MIQQAKQDLELLETQHPNHFEYLKHDLRTLILLLQSQQQPSSALQFSHLSVVSTQASTCEKRTKRSELSSLHEKMERRRCASNKLQTLDGYSGADRVDSVLEKAQSCLRKIQDFKSGLY